MEFLHNHKFDEPKDVGDERFEKVSGSLFVKILGTNLNRSIYPLAVIRRMKSNEGALFKCVRQGHACLDTGTLRI